MRKRQTIGDSEPAEEERMLAGYTLDHAAEKERLERQAKSLYGGSLYLDSFLRNGMTMLDVGSGVGTISRSIATAYPDMKIIGIDTNQERIDEARRRAIEEGTRDLIDFRVGDVYSIPFPDNRFDITHARFLLMHLADPMAALREMIRVTRPGGTVIAHEGFHDAIWITPPRPHFERILRAWKHFMTERGQDPSIGVRLHTLFTRSGLRNVCANVIVNNCTGNDPLFGAYISNWLQHLPSLADSMGDRINNSDIEKMRQELGFSGEDSYYLELTVVGSGRK